MYAVFPIDLAGVSQRAMGTRESLRVRAQQIAPVRRTSPISPQWVEKRVKFSSSGAIDTLRSNVSAQKPEQMRGKQW